MGLLWVPLEDKHAFDPRYGTLSAYGRVFLLYRSFYGALVSDHDVPVSFNTSTADVAILLRGRAINEDIYLSLDHHPSPSFSTSKLLANARLKEKGLKPRLLVAASLDRVPAEYRNAFGLALELLVDKYFLQ